MKIQRVVKRWHSEMVKSQKYQSRKTTLLNGKTSQWVTELLTYRINQEMRNWLDFWRHWPQLAGRCTALGLFCQEWCSSALVCQALSTFWCLYSAQNRLISKASAFMLMPLCSSSHRLLTSCVRSSALLCQIAALHFGTLSATFPVCTTSTSDFSLI